MRVKPMKINPIHTFLLLLLFWCAWLYTEISEKFEREEFNSAVHDFMYKGDRFTSEDGMALEARIRALEEDNE